MIGGVGSSPPPVLSPAAAGNPFAGAAAAPNVDDGSGQASASDGAAAAPPSHGPLGFIGDVFKGAFAAVQDFGKGIADLVTHPMRTGKGFWIATMHPSYVLKAWLGDYKTAFATGHPGEALGRAIVDAATLIMGAGSLVKVARSVGIAGEGTATVATTADVSRSIGAVVASAPKAIFEFGMQHPVVGLAANYLAGADDVTNLVTPANDGTGLSQAGTPLTSTRAS